MDLTWKIILGGALLGFLIKFKGAKPTHMLAGVIFGTLIGGTVAGLFLLSGVDTGTETGHEIVGHFIENKR
jgi:hypothetical protein